MDRRRGRSAQERALDDTVATWNGTKSDLKHAFDLGVKSVRIATHCTEADIAAQHIHYAREIGMDVAGFLMMAHMSPPEALAGQAKLMESYGAHCVYVTDSAGALTMTSTKERARALRDALQSDTQVGIHTHNNLSLGVANAVAAIEEGATRVDASLAGMGAGAGNAALRSCGRQDTWPDTGCDLLALMDAADDLVSRPDRRPGRPRDALLGYAGVIVLPAARRESCIVRIDSRSILIELGKRHMVGGRRRSSTLLSIWQLSASGQQPSV